MMKMKRSVCFFLLTAVILFPMPISACALDIPGYLKPGFQTDIIELTDDSLPALLAEYAAIRVHFRSGRRQLSGTCPCLFDGRDGHAGGSASLPHSGGKYQTHEMPDGEQCGLSKGTGFSKPT